MVSRFFSDPVVVLAPSHPTTRLRFRVALTIGFRAAQSEKQNVQVTDDRQEERVMNADAIGDPTLRNRNNCAANDGHNQDSRTITSEGPKFGNTQRENAWKHNGVEESDQNDAVHGDMAIGQHRHGDQSSSAYRTNAEQCSCLDLLQ